MSEKKVAPSFRAMGQLFGVDAMTVRRWINDGITLKEVYSRLSHIRARQFSYNGETHTATEWARKCGITVAAMRLRIKTNGICEKTFQARSDSRAKVKRYKYKGRNLTIKELAKLAGRCEFTVRQRLRRNMSIAKALEATDLRKKKEQAYSYRGKTKSLSDWSKELGVGEPALVCRFMSMGLLPVDLPSKSKKVKQNVSN